MKFITQPNKSYYCGQCCVAMVAGVSLEDAIEVVGNKKGTNTKQLHKALTHYGINCGSKNRLKPIRGNLSLLPHTAILKIKLAWKKRNWHWVLKCGDKVYDPSAKIPISIKRYAKFKDHIISSYLMVNYQEK